MTITDRVADTYDAAREYVAARLANESAEKPSWESIVRVDAAWARLLDATDLGPEVPSNALPLFANEMSHPEATI